MISTIDGIIKSRSGKNRVDGTVDLNKLIAEQTAADKERIAELKELLACNKKLHEIERLQLSKKIAELEQQLKDKEAKIQDIIKYYETVDINRASPLYKQAFELFTKGKIDEALALLDEEKMVAAEKRSAGARILKAQLFHLKNDFKNAEANFLKAADIFPSFENSLQVANFYYKQNNFQAADTWYTRCLALAKTSEEKAGILNDSGNLHTKMNDHTKAKEAYEEALQILHELADVNPQAYRPEVAMTLNNLGALHDDMNDHLKAKEAYEEALQIRRELADVNPQAYRPDVATTLNNLGVLHCKMKNYTKAKEDYEEALQIYRKLADINPQAYRPDVAMTLNNLGNLHSKMKDYPKAEEAYEEALTIYRDLADVNPQAYRPEVAMTLNNLGILHIDIEDYEEAKKDFEDALNIRRDLAAINQQAYLPDVVNTLTKLAIFYLLSIPDREQSIQYANEVLSYRSSLENIPNALQHIVKAEIVLHLWNKK